MSRSFAMASSQYLNVGNVSALNITSNILTIAARSWQTSIGNNDTFIGKWDGANGGGGGLFSYLLGTNGPGTAWQFAMGGGNISVDFAITSATAFAANSWVHVCGVRNGTSTNSAGLYINGVLKTSATPTLTVASNGTPILIGASKNTGGTDPNNFHDGRLEDVAVWNIALSAGEIAALAAGARPNTIRPTSLAAYYALDGLSSPEPDYSGNTNNAPLVNGPTLAPGAPLMPFTPRWHRYLGWTPTLPAAGLGWIINRRNKLMVPKKRA